MHINSKNTRVECFGWNVPERRISLMKQIKEKGGEGEREMEEGRKGGRHKDKRDREKSSLSIKS